MKKVEKRPKKAFTGTFDFHGKKKTLTIGRYPTQTTQNYWGLSSKSKLWDETFSLVYQVEYQNVMTSELPFGRVFGVESWPSVDTGADYVVLISNIIKQSRQKY